MYVFSKLSELQFKLSSFIIFLEVFFSISDPAKYLIDARQRFGNRGLLKGITEDYKALGMKTEIELVTNILSQIMGDLVQYGYNGGVDINEEYFYRREKMIINLEKECMKVLGNS
jgi:hypothetical protein